MTISMMCPNGHRLTCPEDRAGKGGKCPICGATFRVPVPAQAAAGKAPPPMPRAEAARGDGSHPNMQAAEPAVAAQPVAVQNQIKPYDERRDPAPGPHEVAFLCPEGHHLRGPDSLVDQAGTCPICGTQFLVPSPYDEDGDEPAAKGQSLDQFLSAIDGQTIEAGGDGSALGALFVQLWQYKTQGVTIELHLGDGKFLSPEGFAVESAQQSHGLFISRDANGTHRLSVVAWSAIVFVAVRGLRQLPAGLEFDVR